MSIACFYDFSTIRFENPLYIFFDWLLELINNASPLPRFSLNSHGINSKNSIFTFISFNIKGIAIISLDIQPPIKKYRLAYPNP